MNSYFVILIFSLSINAIYSFPSPYARRAEREYEAPFPYDEQVPVMRRNSWPFIRNFPFDQGQFDFPIRPGQFDLQPRYPQWGGIDDVFRNMEETIRKLKEDLDRAIVVPGVDISGKPTKNETTSKTEVIDGELYQVNKTVLTAGDPEHGEVVKVLVTVRKIENPSVIPEEPITPKVLPLNPDGPETPEVLPPNPQIPETPEVLPPNPEGPETPEVLPASPEGPVPSVPESRAPEQPEGKVPSVPETFAPEGSEGKAPNVPVRRHEMEGENEIPIRITKYYEEGTEKRSMEDVDNDVVSNEIDIENPKTNNVISLRDDTIVNDRISDQQHTSGLVMVDPDAEIIDTNKLLMNNDNKYATSA